MTRPLRLAPYTALLLGGALLLPLLPASGASSGDVTYATGSWPEDGNGNHRAVLHVAEKADAVWAHIEWRRRDRDPQAKDLRLYDLTTGQRVTNVVRASITREAGDIVLQPLTAPGDYAVYYLPYTAPTGNFDDPGRYYPPQDTAAADWIARNHLTADALPAGRWRQLPPAQLLRIEARSEFDRVDPMEITATPEELAGLLGRRSEATYLVFSEDRKFPIRMLDEPPLRWVRSGPGAAFRGEGQPGEFYCFQLGVWAARGPLGKLALETPDLRTEKGALIRRDQITCLNLSGTDWLGVPFTKTLTVPQGRVQPLWIGVQVPRQATGEYTGTFVLRPEGAQPWPVKLTLRVAGPVLEDGGVSDLWRMARLKWLNSSLGLDDNVVPPFTPLRVRGDTVSCLLRDVRFGPLGLPESIRSSGREVLAAPMTLAFQTPRGPLNFVPQSAHVPKITPGVVERVTRARARGADLTVACTMEADGCLMVRVTLQPHRTLRLSDISLAIPQRRDCAVYMMGLGKRGGLRPPQWHWKWDHKRANNMVWLGDVTAGMQLQLRGAQDVWEPVALTPAGFAPAWDNDGKGGCDVTEGDGRVLVRAYTGDRVLRAGQPLELRFRLLITPLKPLDRNHWNWRYGDTNADGTVFHLHHGTPENPYINYPFLTVPQITDLVKAVKASTVRHVDPGKLTYPAPGSFNPDHGSVHLWTTVDFDPAAGGAGQSRYNQSLFAVAWPNGDRVGFYWNIDDRGMRVYVARGPVGSYTYPILLPSNAPGWRRGQQHLISLSWGSEIAVFVDGVCAVRAPFKGTLDTPLDQATVELEGSGFLLHALKLSDAPYTGGALPTPSVDAHTLLLDDFAAWKGGRVTQPRRAAAGAGGTITGVAEATGQGDQRALHLTYRVEPTPRKGLNIYDNVGQMSNHAAELWVIRSLGDEVIPIHDTNPAKVGATVFGTEGAGYPWLQEHLVSGYVPGWRQPLPWIAQTCASLEMQPLSRWHNYYIEGLSWLMRTTGLDGLYLDGISYDREIMKRVAKVMVRNDPACRLNCHGGDNWSAPWDPDRRVSTANAYLEHFPYLSNLWFGELYDYNMPPDYWLVEMSGLPFGLTSEMLNVETGGNPYRGMIYGMTGRLHPSCSAMWRFWDEFGIQDADWLGYWDPRCPVHTDNPSVLATVYRKSGKSLLALAHWPGNRGRPTAAAHAVATPPTIDGTLSPGEWDQAARLTNFTVHDGDGQAADQTEVYVTWDRQRLYIGFRCAQPGGHLQAAARARDGEVWGDDAVEIFLQPDPQSATYYQFIGNAAGTIYDARGAGDPGWNGDWTYKAAVGADCWTGELSIPLASLGIKLGAGDTVLGLNICRDQKSPPAPASCWAPISGSFHNPGLFGTLVLSPTTPSTRQEPAAKSGGEALNVRLRVDWRALGLDPKRVKLTAPEIAGFQHQAEFTADQPIPIEIAKGWLLVAHQ